MSRVEVTNEKFMVAFGVDRITSSYVQVWKQPHDEQERAFLVIDNQGLRMDKEVAKELDSTFLDFLATIEKRFVISRRRGNRFPNLDADTIIRVMTLLGIPVNGVEVYKALD